MFFVCFYILCRNHCSSHLRKCTAKQCCKLNKLQYICKCSLDVAWSNDAHLTQATRLQTLILCLRRVYRCTNPANPHCILHVNLFLQSHAAIPRYAASVAALIRTTRLLTSGVNANAETPIGRACLGHNVMLASFFSANVYRMKSNSAIKQSNRRCFNTKCSLATQFHCYQVALLPVKYTSSALKTGITPFSGRYLHQC